MAGKRLRISPADRDEWLHRCAELRDGLGDGVPFVLILVVMTLRAQRCAAGG